MERKGDRFEVFRDGRLWYWRLVVSHSPSPTPVARSGRGYRSKPEVLAAIKSARLASAASPADPIFVDR